MSYTKMNIASLRKEAKNRGLNVPPVKSKIIRALEEDDASSSEETVAETTPSGVPLDDIADGQVALKKELRALVARVEAIEALVFDAEAAPSEEEEDAEEETQAPSVTLDAEQAEAILAWLEDEDTDGKAIRAYLIETAEEMGIENLDVPRNAGKATWIGIARQFFNLTEDSDHEDDAAPEEDGDHEVEIDPQELLDMDLKELKAWARENIPEVDLRGRISIETLQERVFEALGTSLEDVQEQIGDEEGEEEEVDEEEGEEAVEFSSMSKKDMLDFIEANDLGEYVNVKLPRKKLAEALEELYADEEEEPEEEEEENPMEALLSLTKDDINSSSKEELLGIANELGLKTNARLPLKVLQTQVNAALKKFAKKGNA